MDRKYELVKNTAIITIGKLCTQFISFLLLPLYTAVLSTEEYGTVDLFTTYINLLLPLGFFQIEQSLFRFIVDVREDECGQDEVFSTVCTFTLFQSVVIIVLFFVLRLFIHIPYDIISFTITCNGFLNVMLWSARD